MLNRHVKLAVLLSAAWLSQAASAGEVILFSNPGFQGRDVTVRDTMRDLNALNFNDRSGSMIVRSGRWEVCVDADFRKQCQVFEPGEYPNLERMTNNITSLREIDGGRVDGYRDNRDGGRGDDYRDNRDGGRGDDNRDNRDGYRDNRDDDRDGRGNRRGRAASVQLFDSPELRGRSIVLRDDVDNLSSLNFNDRTQSMVVEAGTWEFCQHNNFRGQCKVYEPGRYRNLDRAFYRSITSARVLEQDRGRGRGHGRRDDDQGRREGVELFADEGFGGDRMQVREEIRNLAQHNYNDKAGSLIVYSGQWEFCQHGDFRGQCMTYGPGRYDRLGSLNDAISSIRRVR